MSLADFVIESFGGYEKAKAVLDIPNAHFLHNIEGLKQRLLEYRHQHNIFEVGDKVVYKPSMVQGVIFTVIGFDDFGWMKTEAFFEGFDHPKRFSEDPPFSDIRHATDEEIKAGRRLEVNTIDSNIDKQVNLMDQFIADGGFDKAFADVFGLPESVVQSLKEVS